MYGLSIETIYSKCTLSSKNPRLEIPFQFSSPIIVKAFIESSRFVEADVWIDVYLLTHLFVDNLRSADFYVFCETRHVYSQVCSIVSYRITIFRILQFTYFQCCWAKLFVLLCPVMCTQLWIFLLLFVYVLCKQHQAENITISQLLSSLSSYPTIYFVWWWRWLRAVCRTNSNT